MKGHLQNIFITVILIADVSFVLGKVHDYEENAPSTLKTTTGASEQSPEEVRVVTDYYSIVRGGAPIEYWYNETLANQKYPSAPGCPQSIDGFPWVYYENRPETCFLVGFIGPCAYGEKLMLQSNSTLFGVCACECFGESEDDYLFLPKVSFRYLSCTRSANKQPLVFDKQSGKCYGHLEQGPCSDGNLISDWTENNLTCLPKCNTTSSDLKKTEEKGLCVKDWWYLYPPAVYLVTVSSIGSLFQLPDCPNKQQYSYTLRKCVFKNEKLKDSPVG